MGTPVFPSGYPTMYYPQPKFLNFGDRTNTDVFNMIWPLNNQLAGVEHLLPDLEKFYQNL